MALKDILLEIDRDVTDVASTEFIYNNTVLVPAANDTGLSFERGVSKKGKALTTCVLFVDIRDSVLLTEKHQSITMGRIYTAFTKAVIKAARYHDGHTRNIIGDRVMIVFPEAGCFTNAVSCALSINHIARKIISARFPSVAFKCGIGIDHGELKIIKVGIQRNGVESAENKGLVWTGYPANRSSRLTDMAHKTIDEIYFEVTYFPINSAPSLGLYEALIKPRFPQPVQTPQPFYSSVSQTREHTETEFANCIHAHKDGTLFYVWGKLISFQKKTRTKTYPAILITSAVYTGLKREGSNPHLYKEGYWHEQELAIRNVSSKVFGSDIIWAV